MKAAVALNPATPVSALSCVLEEADLFLLMTVNPGFGGQKFIPNTLRKLRELRALIGETGSKALVEIDGGVNADTGRQLAEAGADVLVAGNYVFKSANPLEAIATLNRL